MRFRVFLAPLSRSSFCLDLSQVSVKFYLSSPFPSSIHIHALMEPSIYNIIGKYHSLAFSTHILSFSNVFFPFLVLVSSHNLKSKSYLSKSVCTSSWSFYPKVHHTTGPNGTEKGLQSIFLVTNPCPDIRLFS